MFVEEKYAKPHLKRMLKRFAILFYMLTLCQPSLATTTEWAQTEGGAMRLIVTSKGNGLARGVLQIKLEPGWKTYWREPGDGGIPPSLSGHGMQVELLFPAPERISEKDQTISGYHGSVNLPFVLPETLLSVYKLTAFIGICSDVCVPFQAEFALVADIDDVDIVEPAFAGLPKPATAGDGITSFVRQGEILALTSAAQDGVLFLAPEKGVYLGIPDANATGFTVKVRKEKIPGVKVHYTLKTRDGAISGTFFMPK